LSDAGWRNDSSENQVDQDAEEYEAVQHSYCSYVVFYLDGLGDVGNQTEK